METRPLIDDATAGATRPRPVHNTTLADGEDCRLKDTYEELLHSGYVAGIRDFVPRAARHAPCAGCLVPRARASCHVPRASSHVPRATCHVRAASPWWRLGGRRRRGGGGVGDAGDVGGLGGEARGDG